MKIVYDKPTVEIVECFLEDIISTSGGISNGGVTENGETVDWGTLFPKSPSPM